jgi:hypothetical protein
MTIVTPFIIGAHLIDFVVVYQEGSAMVVNLN